MSEAKGTSENSISAQRIIRRFMPFARPYRASVVGAIVLVIFRVVSEVLQPLSLKIVIDNVLKGKPLEIGAWIPGLAEQVAAMDRWELLTAVSISAAILTLLYGIFAYFSNSRIAAIGQNLTYDIRKSLFAHLQSLSLSFYESRRTADIMGRINNDISNIQELLVSVISVLLVNVLTIFGILIMMFQVDSHLSIVSLVVTPVLFFVARFYTKSIKDIQRKAKRRESQITSVVQENLQSVRIVQGFVRQAHEAERFDRQSRKAKKAGLRSTELQAQFDPIIEMTTTLATLLVVFLGGQRVLQDQMTVGTLVVFMTYIKILYSPIRQLAKLVNLTTKATISAERVVEILDTAPEIRDLPGATVAETFKGHVQFQNVNFAYNKRGGAPGLGEPILKNISLDVKPGTTVAVIGSTGSGKSTLMNLIARFYDPTSGAVMIDGQDIKSLTVDSVRSQISHVPQEALLFRAPIWENIAYGCLDFPAGFGEKWLLKNRDNPVAIELMSRIVQASEMAHAAEFIDRLTDGYNTMLGERGSTLSGGQRQRIAIARAMIRNAPILILDEPTTGLDAASERLVVEALNRLKHGRTTFVVAHHLSTIRDADMVLVMDQGEIIERGSHAELYREGTRYKYLYDLSKPPSDRPTMSGPSSENVLALI